MHVCIHIVPVVGRSDSLHTNVIMCRMIGAQLTGASCRQRTFFFFFFFFFVTSTGMESSILGGQIREFEQALGVKPVDKFNDISLEGWVVDPFCSQDVLREFESI